MKLAILHTPLTMTFSFFLPPANAVSGRATMSAASTSRGERITVLDATFAEEQLRSGSFIGTPLYPFPCPAFSIYGLLSLPLATTRRLTPFFALFVAFGKCISLTF